MNLEDPNELLLETSRILKHEQIPFALYGGLALAVYGVPRETVDVDHLVLDDSLDSVLAALKSRFPGAQTEFRNLRMGGLKITRVSVISPIGGADHGLNVVDLVTPLDHAYAERALKRRVTGPLRGEEIPVISIEDLIILKILSTRPQDLEDAVRILGANEESTETEIIEDEIARLAKAIPGHEINERWAHVTEALARGKRAPWV